MSLSDARSQRGSLPFALLAVIVVAGLIVVFVARALTETRATATEQSFESAMHVAEAGLDAVIAEVNELGSFVTTDPGGNPHEYTLSGSATEAQQRQWAIATASPLTCKLDEVDAYRGQTCGIRPVEPSGVDVNGDGETGQPLPWIFAVGFVPDAVDPVRTRVVKVIFDKGFFSPEKAILTSGPLTIGGDLTIDGTGGAVHTNSSLTVTGCSWSATGTVTYTGSTSQTCSGAVATEPSPPVAVPEYSAEMVYRGTDGATAAANAFQSWLTHRDSSGYVYGSEPIRTEEVWYDLCFDGTVRVPRFVAGDPAPCSADTQDGHSLVLYDANAEGAPAHYRGWSWNSAQSNWELGGGSRPVYDGAYYVYHADVDIGGSLVSANGSGPVSASIIVDAHGDIDFDAGTDTTCGGSWTGGESGSITMSGVGAGTLNPNPALQDLLFVADRDIRINGNNSTTVNGFVGAHEQFEVTGTPSINGAVAARDACDLPSSPVHSNTASGNFGILHSGDLNLPLPSVVRITYWSEF